MCGIYSVLGNNNNIPREEAIARASTLQHRGPDDFFCVSTPNSLFCFHRLAVSTPTTKTGRQPFVWKKRYIAVVNGEIYNHRALRQQHMLPDDDESDCSVIIHLYHKCGPSFIRLLDGMFAFVLYDNQENLLMIGRDHAGIIPLYMGRDTQGRLHIASECKALVGLRTAHIFPPRQYYHGTPEACSIETLGVR